MSTSPESYTPAQYLDAGFRAEMAGERDSAIQYYHYIAEAFPETLEGEAARGGLMRLGQSSGLRRQPATGVIAPQSPWPTDTATGSIAHGRGQPGPANAASEKRRAGVDAGERAASSPQGPPGLQAAAARYASHPIAGEASAAAGHRIRLGEIAHMDIGRRTGPGQPMRHGMERSDGIADAGGAEPMRLPEVVARRARALAGEEEGSGFRPRYRNARRLAHMVTIIGWLVVAGGLSLLVLTVLGVAAPLPGQVGGIAVGIIVGGGAGVMGLALALGGLVAVAIFDQADALREIGSLLKARVDL